MKLVLDTKEILENGLDTVELDLLKCFLGEAGYDLIKKQTEKAHSVTETVSEGVKKEKTTQSKGTTKKEPESAPTQDGKKPDTRKVDVTLETVKALAQLKVKETDKDTVKNIINKYATKLAEVKESDFEALYKELQELGA